MNDTAFVALLMRLFGRQWHRYVKALGWLRRRAWKRRIEPPGG